MANIEETCRRSTSYSDDVNFDSVIDLEESCLRQGFQTGQAASKAKLARDGLALGLNKGWTIGEEVGHIKGLATSHLQLLLADDTILQVCIKFCPLWRLFLKDSTSEPKI